MNVSYYPGCSLEGTAKSYNASTLSVCDTLGIQTTEVPEWSCCGSSPALKMDKLMSLSLAAYNLAKIEQQALSDVLIPCPFCFRRLLSAQEDIRQNETLKSQVQDTIEAELQGNLNIYNLPGYFLNELGLDAIRSKVVKPLEGLKIVPYYGCYLIKPTSVTHFDDPENPTSLDKILEALGATVLDWDFKTECCGAGLALSKTRNVEELCTRIVDEAVWRGADGIALACQLCQANIDMRQQSAKKLPVMYITQLMGLAFGTSPDVLGLKKHLVSPLPSLTRKGLV